MSENYLTLKQLIEVVDIPENSCKRYLQEHEDFLNYKKVHNRYMIHVSAVETLKIIRKLYGEGLKKEAVDEHLRGAGVPVTITMDSEDSTALVSVNEELQELKKMMQLQMEFNQRLVQQMESDKQEMQEKFNKEIEGLKTLLNRHESEKVEQLRLSMSKSVEEITEASKKAVEDMEAKFEAKIEEEKNRGFFSRLFGK
ncbi:hypothetical protein [Lysinibacillus capsici]|uniref:hypothetical protein n=1 Tax=Lysinibacillus capsici TaxID=2115968 RepID=UPI0034E22A07